MSEIELRDFDFVRNNFGFDIKYFWTIKDEIILDCVWKKYFLYGFKDYNNYDSLF